MKELNKQKREREGKADDRKRALGYVVQGVDSKMAVGADMVCEVGTVGRKASAGYLLTAFQGMPFCEERSIMDNTYSTKRDNREKAIGIIIFGRRRQEQTTIGKH